MLNRYEGRILTYMKQICREELIIQALLMECLIDGARIWRIDPDPVCRASPAQLMLPTEVLHALLRLNEIDSFSQTGHIPNKIYK